MDRQLEYDKGPAVDEQETATDSDDAAPRDDASSGNGGDSGHEELGLVESARRSGKAGLGFGVGSFVVVYALSYQLAAAMFSGGMFAGAEDQPSRWIVAGLTMLGSHGAQIIEGEESVQMAFSVYGSLTSHVSAFVPVLVLSLAGFLLVRYLRTSRFEETVRNSAIAGSVFVSSYVLLAVALAEVATWAPEEAETAGGGTAGTGEESDAIAVAVDSSMVLTTTGTVVAFLVVGGLVAVVLTIRSE